MKTEKIEVGDIVSFGVDESCISRVGHPRDFQHARNVKVIGITLEKHEKLLKKARVDERKQIMIKLESYQEDFGELLEWMGY